MFNRVFRLLVAIPLVVIMIIIVVVNINLGYDPEIAVQGSDTIQSESLKELRGLANALDRNADLEMQNIYPEGYVFLNAVYSLAWFGFLQHEGHQKYLEEGKVEIQKAWNKIDSPTGRAPFSEDLPLPYGSFYNGWSAYILALKLRLERATMRDNREVHHFKQQCDRIADAIQRTTYPLSYHAAAWPADVVVCVASLSLHDHLFEPKYKEVIEKWLSEVKKRVDVRGMIPHSVDTRNAEVYENARGSSTALMLIFLHEIDYPFAHAQFRLFHENFIDTRFGLNGIREYPRSEFGEGDIDSGPVVMGFGGAATIVGMQTLSLFGADELSLQIRNTVEAMAFPRHTEQQKRYFFGTLPMADGFIAWSHSGMQLATTPDSSFANFRAYSLLLFTILAVLFWIVISRNPSIPEA